MVSLMQRLMILLKKSRTLARLPVMRLTVKVLKTQVFLLTRVISRSRVLMLLLVMIVMQNRLLFSVLTFLIIKFIILLNMPLILFLVFVIIL